MDSNIARGEKFPEDIRVLRMIGRRIQSRQKNSNGVELGLTNTARTNRNTMVNLLLLLIALLLAIALFVAGAMWRARVT